MNDHNPHSFNYDYDPWPCRYCLFKEEVSYSYVLIPIVQIGRLRLFPESTLSTLTLSVTDKLHCN